MFPLRTNTRSIFTIVLKVQDNEWQRSAMKEWPKLYRSCCIEQDRSAQDLIRFETNRRRWSISEYRTQRKGMTMGNISVIFSMDRHGIVTETANDIVLTVHLPYRRSLSQQHSRFGRYRWKLPDVHAGNPRPSCLLCVSRSHTHTVYFRSAVWVAACVFVTWKAIDKSAKGAGEQRKKPAYVAPPISFGEIGPFCGQGGDSSYLFACRQSLWMYEGFKGPSVPHIHVYYYAARKMRCARMERIVCIAKIKFDIAFLQIRGTFAEGIEKYILHPPLI